MTLHSSDDMHGQGTVSASARTEILRTLVEIALNGVNLQLDAFTSRLADAMQRTAASSIDAKEGARYTDGAQLLKKNRYAFHYVVSERLQTVLQQEIEAIGEAPVSTIGVSGPKPLEPELEVDKKLTLLKVSRTIDSEHAERLDALNRRLARLFGMEALTTAQNPFRPHVLLLLIHDAWCEFYPDAAAHHLIFPLLGPYLCIDSAPILHALNIALAKRGILPTLARPHQVELVEPKRVDEEPAPSSEDAVATKLRRLFTADQPPADKRRDRALEGGFPALFEDKAVQATASRNELFSYLANIQRTRFDRHLAACAGNGPQGESMLAHVKRQLPEGALTLADESTIDLLSGIFDTVFREKHIPEEIRTLIGSLQVPVLKAALLDREFFFDTQHAARRVIELLARIGIGWDRNKGHNDLLYQTIQRNVNRIHEGHDQPSVAFSKAAWDLESFLTREETAATHTLAKPINEALQQEKTREAKQTAKHQVALRVGTGEVVAFVETFLEDKWVSVLTLAYGVKDEKPAFAENALKTMDDLVWSVKPKITMAERKELLAKLPPMIAALNKWLDLTEWDESERNRFFMDLAKCHASIVRAPLELSPERQVQIALKVAKQAAERRARKEAARLPEPEPDEFDHAVATLELGAWLEFKEDSGATLKLKLAWVSPMRNFFVFSTKGKLESRSMSVEELTQILREERACVVQVSGLVGRALSAALSSASADSRAGTKSVA